MLHQINVDFPLDRPQAVLSRCFQDSSSPVPRCESGTHAAGGGVAARAGATAGSGRAAPGRRPPPHRRCSGRRGFEVYKGVSVSQYRGIATCV